MSDTTTNAVTGTARSVSLFAARDDRFHFDELGSNRWVTETAWFSFVVPERRLGGWLYSMVRPNIDCVSGGAWVWDDSGVDPWTVLYSSNQAELPFDSTQDLDRIDLSNGVSITAIQPATTYDVAYNDPGLLSVELRFTGVMEPFGLAGGWWHNFDQFGRVVGQIDIRGETIDVDCLAIRNRTWGIREGGSSRLVHCSYVSGITDDKNGFLALVDVENDDFPIYGFLLLDGETAPVVAARRTVDFNRSAGWIDAIRVELTDANGRSLVANGRSVSRIFIDRRNLVDCNSVIEWSVEGIGSGWGEDQYCVSNHAWPPVDRE